MGIKSRQVLLMSTKNEIGLLSSWSLRSEILNMLSGYKSAKQLIIFNDLSRERARQIV